MDRPIRAGFIVITLAMSVAAAACGGSDSDATSADAGASGDGATADAGGDATTVGDGSTKAADAATGDAEAGPANDGGDGGDAADGSDNGAPSSVYPAFQRPYPHLVKGSGDVLKSPGVRVVQFAGDTLATGVADTLSIWFGSGAWAQQTSEYGIGQAYIQRTTLASSAPATIDIANVGAWVASQLDGTHPELGSVDSTTLSHELLVFVFPDATTVTAAGKPLCANLVAYHDALTLASGAPVYYAVVPRCAATDGGFPASDADVPNELTFAATAATLSGVGDPGGYAHPAYAAFDDDHVAWSALARDQELASACDFENFPRSDASAPLARAWSNASIAAGHDPCVPAPSDPYFESVPVLNDTITMPMAQAPTKGVLIPVGAQRTIDVLLSSDAPTSGPWTVSAAEARPNGSPALELSFDRTSGVNGEKLHLTITAKKAGAIPFVVTSTLGGRTTKWAGMVGQS